MSGRDVLPRLKMTGGFKQPAGVLFSTIDVALLEPEFRLACLQPDVVAPAHPGVARENGIDVAEGFCGFFSFVLLYVVKAEIDQGIGFGFKDLVFPSQLDTTLIVSDRTGEILQFAIDPTHTVGEARHHEVIAIAPANFDRLVEISERLRHSSQIAKRHSLCEETNEQREAIAQFRCEASDLFEEF